MLLRSLLLASVSGGTALAQDSFDNTPFDGNVDIVALGLEHPWSIAFLPDGDLLVTERTGQLRLITPDGLQAAPVAGAPDAQSTRQGGMMDVVLHPDFETNRLIYLTHATGTYQDSRLSISRGRYEDGALSEVETIFTSDIGNDTGGHYGGRLTFLPDGTFIVGYGDGSDYREEAQDPSNHFGTTIRLNADGSVPADNPDIENGALGVYSWGHRNPQGMIYDAETGRIISHEHGPRGGDEINIVEPGVNYGWPIATYGVEYSGAVISPFQTYEGMRDAIHVWETSIAPAGMTLYRGDMFPEWEGDLIVAALQDGDADTVSGHLRIVEMEDGAPVGQIVTLGGREARIRDVRTAPDGSLYVLTDHGSNGQVLRLSR